MHVNIKDCFRKNTFCLVTRPQIQTHTNAHCSLTHKLSVTSQGRCGSGASPGDMEFKSSQSTTAHTHTHTLVHTKGQIISVRLPSAMFSGAGEKPELRVKAGTLEL